LEAPVNLAEPRDDQTLDSPIIMKSPAVALAERVVSIVIAYRQHRRVVEETPDVATVELVRTRVLEELQDASRKTPPGSQSAVQLAERLIVYAVDGIMADLLEVPRALEECQMPIAAVSWRPLEFERYETWIGGSDFYACMTQPQYARDDLRRVAYLCLAAGFRGSPPIAGAEHPVSNELRDKVLVTTRSRLLREFQEERTDLEKDKLSPHAMQETSRDRSDGLASVDLRLYGVAVVGIVAVLSAVSNLAHKKVVDELRIDVETLVTELAAAS
jgi:type VI protein secretion system component VasF